MADRNAKSLKLFSRGTRGNGKDYLDELEKKLKLNKGGFSTFAEDTQSPNGFIVPGAMPVKESLGLPQIAGQSATLNQAPQYQEIPEFDAYPGFDLSQNVGMQDFITALTQAAQAGYESQYGSIQDQQEYLFQTQGVDYGIGSQADGGVLMRSGKVSYNYQPAQAIQSRPDGTVLFSDGTVRVPGIHFDGGLSGLQGLLGLSGQAITQAYGNYNPSLEPGSGYNLGTDIRTRDLANRAIMMPIGARVVQILRDDGTRWGDKSGHQGYGNSVLLELPTGEKIRLSHFDVLGDLQEGQMIAPGTFIGIPGTTGNTSGEHLDLEYYNRQGQIDNPAKFTGFYDPGAVVASSPVQSQPSTPASQAQTPQINSVPQQQPMGTPMLDMVRGAAKAGGSLVQAIASNPQIVTSPTATVGTALEQFGTEKGLPGFGVGELSRNDLAGAARELGATTANYVDKKNPTGDLDFGGTEAFRGQWGEAKDKFLDATSRIAARVTKFPQQLQNEIIPIAYADNNDKRPESLRENLSAISSRVGSELSQQVDRAQKLASPAYEGIKQTVENLGDGAKGVGDQLAQAGQGIRSLFSKGGAGINLFSRPSGEQLAPRRSVGASGSSGDQLGNAPLLSTVAASRAKDTSDPFFKSPQFEALRPFTIFGQGEPIKNQALSMDIFQDSFYQDPGRVASVFESTYMADPALRKATESVKQAFRERYSGGEYDQADVERILASLPATLNYTPNLPEPKKKEVESARPSLDDYLRQGKTMEQWFAETGQQSTLDSIRKSGQNPVSVMTDASVKQGSYTPQQAAGQQVQSVTYPSGRTVTASPGNYLTADSAGEVQRVRMGDTPVKAPSAQLNTSSKTGTGLFSGVSNLFKRFFN